MRQYITYIVITSVFLLACQEDRNSVPQFIIQGSIFAGEPVNNIVVKALVPIDEVDTVDRIIDNAIVTIEKNSVRYNLDFDNDHYYYGGNDLEVQSGDVFRLEVTVDGLTASAETTVPNATQGLTLTESEVVVPALRLSFDLVDELGELFFTNRTTAKWENPTEDLHFVVVEPVVNPFDSIFPPGFPQEGIDFLSSFKFAPSATELDTFSIIGISFESYGRHRVKVFRVNQEYADLFDNPTQDSRDLTAAPSNVVNGFGIFSAFAADSVFFDIVRE